MGRPITFQTRTLGTQKALSVVIAHRHSTVPTPSKMNSPFHSHLSHNWSQTLATLPKTHPLLSRKPQNPKSNQSHLPHPRRRNLAPLQRSRGDEPASFPKPISRGNVAIRLQTRKNPTLLTCVKMIPALAFPQHTRRASDSLRTDTRNSAGFFLLSPHHQKRAAMRYEKEALISHPVATSIWRDKHGKKFSGILKRPIAIPNSESEKRS